MDVAVAHACTLMETDIECMDQSKYQVGNLSSARLLQEVLVPTDAPFRAAVNSETQVCATRHVQLGKLHSAAESSFPAPRGSNKQSNFAYARELQRLAKTERAHQAWEGTVYDNAAQTFEYLRALRLQSDAAVAVAARNVHAPLTVGETGTEPRAALDKAMKQYTVAMAKVNKGKASRDQDVDMLASRLTMMQRLSDALGRTYAVRRRQECGTAEALRSMYDTVRAYHVQALSALDTLTPHMEALAAGTRDRETVFKATTARLERLRTRAGEAAATLEQQRREAQQQRRIMAGGQSRTEIVHLAELNQFVDEILSLDGNGACADCSGGGGGSSNTPTHALRNLGILVCEECARAHAADVEDAASAAATADSDAGGRAGDNAGTGASASAGAAGTTSGGGGDGDGSGGDEEGGSASDTARHGSSSVTLGRDMRWCTPVPLRPGSKEQRRDLPWRADILLARGIGNTVANAVLESSELAKSDRPTARASQRDRREYLTAKYSDLRYARGGTHPSMSLEQASLQASWTDLVLHVSSLAGRKRVRGAEGALALRTAARHGRDLVVEFLLLNGADVLAVDPNSGLSALHHAAAYAESETVKILLRHGANRHARGAQGQTPLDYCPADTPASHLLQGEGDLQSLQIDWGKQSAFVEPRLPPPMSGEISISATTSPSPSTATAATAIRSSNNNNNNNNIYGNGGNSSNNTGNYSGSDRSSSATSPFSPAVSAIGSGGNGVVLQALRPLPLPPPGVTPATLPPGSTATLLRTKPKTPALSLQLPPPPPRARASSTVLSSPPPPPRSSRDRSSTVGGGLDVLATRQQDYEAPTAAPVASVPTGKKKGPPPVPITPRPSSQQQAALPVPQRPLPPPPSSGVPASASASAVDPQARPLPAAPQTLPVAGLAQQLVAQQAKGRSSTAASVPPAHVQATNGGDDGGGGGGGDGSGGGSSGPPRKYSNKDEHVIIGGGGGGGSGGSGSDSGGAPSTAPVPAPKPSTVVRSAMAPKSTQQDPPPPPPPPSSGSPPPPPLSESEPPEDTESVHVYTASEASEEEKAAEVVASDYSLAAVETVSVPLLAPLPDDILALAGQPGDYDNIDKCSGLVMPNPQLGGAGDAGDAGGGDGTYDNLAGTHQMTAPKLGDASDLHGNPFLGLGLGLDHSDIRAASPPLASSKNNVETHAAPMLPPPPKNEGLSSVSVATTTTSDGGVGGRGGRHGPPPPKPPPPKPPQPKPRPRTKTLGAREGELKNNAATGAARVTKTDVVVDSISIKPSRNLSLSASARARPARAEEESDEEV
eukprot:UC1_evm3s1915